MCVVAFCLNKVSAGSKKKEKKIRLNTIQKIIATEREVYTHVQGLEDEMRWVKVLELTSDRIFI